MGRNRKNEPLTQAHLKERLHYDPNTGAFTWIASQSPSLPPGTNAGRTPVGNSYVTIQIDGLAYQAHRLAWLYVYGEFPEGTIDHINRSKHDNRIKNLRAVSQRDNNINKPLQRNNKSGHKGVMFHKRYGKWMATAKYNGRTFYLGYYHDIQDAINARRNFAKKIYGDLYNDEHTASIRRMMP